MKLSNGLTTFGGVIAALGAIPIGIGTFDKEFHKHINMPDWLYIICIFAAALGPVLVGVGAKGKDEHSTTDEVQQSTKAAKNA